MTSNPLSDLHPKVQDLTDFNVTLLQSIKMLRRVGYGLLLVMLISFVETFIPFKPMDPGWEFNTFRQLVERMPIPLMGFILVFHGQQYGRPAWEKRLLAWLSHTMLILGLILLLLIPLGVLNTFRIDDLNQTQFNILVNQRQEQLNMLEQRLAQADTPDALRSLALLLQRPDLARAVSESAELDTPKEALRKHATTTHQSSQQQSQRQRSQQRSELFKQSIKVNLIALISAVLFVGLWRSTDWTRRLR